AAEEYILARYYMYWQVYLHKTTRAHELILRRAWQRAADLWREGRLAAGDAPTSLLPFLEGRAALGAYLELDDHDVLCALKTWRRHPDPILADLCSRFLDRRLLKPLFKVPLADVDLGAAGEARERLRRAGWDPAYYFQIDRTGDVAYDYY